MVEGNEHLITRIHEMIRKKGRITFAEFMESALYDPDYGYYTSGREKIGIGGDYLTAPEMHPAFGASIGEWIIHRWRELGSPTRLEVVEMGAGKDLLFLPAAARITVSVPHLHYTIIETGNTQCLDSTHDTPIPKNCELNILKSLSDIPDDSITGCFISNELIDAFPFHLVTIDGSRIKEIYLTLHDEMLVEEVDEPSTPEIPAYFDRLGIALTEGYRTEVNLRALYWIRELANKLHKGFALTIDYGYNAERYYHPERRRGTLLTYYRHTYAEDPYIRIGHQDITAHVDFTSLQMVGEDSGLEAVSFPTQRDFLLIHGIEKYIQDEKSRRAIGALIDPRGMGAFRVLIQKKFDI